VDAAVTDVPSFLEHRTVARRLQRKQRDVAANGKLASAYARVAELEATVSELRNQVHVAHR
jgi:hypothetical protein